MGWMRFLNSDDVVAVLDAILPFMDANTAAMPPFWIEIKISENWVFPLYNYRKIN